MKLNLKTELIVALIPIFAVTCALAVACADGIAFGGYVLNKWTILIFYCLAVAELLHIKMKASKCTSSSQSETKDQSSS